MFETSKDIDECRLAGARRPHNRDPFASLNLETHVAESTDGIEPLFEIFDLNQRRHHSPRNISAGRTRPSSRSGTAPVSATPTPKEMVAGKAGPRGEMAPAKTRPPIRRASTMTIANPIVPPTTP